MQSSGGPRRKKENFSIDKEVSEIIQLGGERSLANICT